MQTEIEKLLNSDPEFVKLDACYWIGKKDGHGEGKVEGIVEGKIEGKVEGKVEGKALAYQSSIRKILESRFGLLPAELTESLESIFDVARLEPLVVEALRAADLDTFRSVIE